MPRPSLIARLPEATRQWIASRRQAGATIDELRSVLARGGITLSRSTLGRHIRRLEEPCPITVGEQLAALRASVDRLADDIRGLRQLIVGAE